VWKYIAMDNVALRAILTEIASLLETGHEDSFAMIVRNALSGSAKTIEDFLRSNELWGGAGSIADQPFTGNSTQRKELEQLLIRLGRVQIDAGNTNIRTESWVVAFEKWQKLGLR
jgi:hypothetical protein